MSYDKSVPSLPSFSTITMYVLGAGDALPSSESELVPALSFVPTAFLAVRYRYADR